MRVVVQALADPSFWFKPTHEEDEYGAALDSLGSQAVLATNAEIYNRAVSPGEKSRDSEYLLAEYFRSRVKTIALSDKPTKAEFELDGNRKLFSLLNSPSFRSAWQEHSKTPLKGEESIAVFNRMFAHLLSVSKSVTFIDKHLFEKWDDAESGASRFLELLLRTPNPKISLLTLDKPSMSPRHLEVIQENIRHIKSKFGSTTDLEIRLFRDSYRSPLPHDRIGQIQFDVGAVPFTIGYGAQIFKNRTLFEPSVVAAIPAQLQDIAEAVRHLDSRVLNF